MKMDIDCCARCSLVDLLFANDTLRYFLARSDLRGFVTLHYVCYLISDIGQHLFHFAKEEIEKTIAVKSSMR